jgi:Sulfotransferase domain
MSSARLLRVRHRLSRTPLRLPLVWWRHRGIRAGDVFLASYPRSGNTWLRFLLFELVTGRTAEFGEIDAPESPTGQIGDQRHMPAVLRDGGRLIKTHELHRHEYRRAVYLVRDPRDVMVSQLGFMRWQRLGRARGDFLEPFLQGRVTGLGSWQRHVASWLGSEPAARGEVLRVRYEDLREDPARWLQQIAGFLGLDPSDEDVLAAVRHNALARMRAREDRARYAVYPETDPQLRFVNRGRVAGWRETLDPRAAARIEEQWAETLRDLGYPTTTVNGAAN